LQWRIGQREFCSCVQSQVPPTRRSTLQSVNWFTKHRCVRLVFLLVLTFSIYSSQFVLDVSLRSIYLRHEHVFRCCISFVLYLVATSFCVFLLSFVEILEVIIHPSPSDHILGLSIGIRARHSLCSACFGLTSWSVAKYVICSYSLWRTYSCLQWKRLPILEGQDDEKHHIY